MMPGFLVGCHGVPREVRSEWIMLPSSSVLNAASNWNTKTPIAPRRAMKVTQSVSNTLNAQTATGNSNIVTPTTSFGKSARRVAPALGVHSLSLALCLERTIHCRSIRTNLEMSINVGRIRIEECPSWALTYFSGSPLLNKRLANVCRGVVKPPAPNLSLSHAFQNTRFRKLSICTYERSPRPWRLVHSSDLPTTRQLRIKSNRHDN
jgi:hypothetical protein